MPRPSKSPDKIIADLEAQRAALDAKLEEARAKQAELEAADNAKCDGLIARVVRDHMANDPTFSDGIKRLLNSGIKKKGDRALLEKRGLLPDSGGHTGNGQNVVERPTYGEG